MIESSDSSQGITKSISFQEGFRLRGYYENENNNVQYTSDIEYRGNSGWKLDNKPIMVKEVNINNTSQEALQLKSPDGTVFNITVDDNGNLSATPVSNS